MKTLLTVLLLAVSGIASAQLKDTLEAERFWADNIQNIVQGKKELVLQQVHFPIRVAGKDLTKAQFQKMYDQLFPEALKADLGEMDVLDIDAWVMLYDTTPTYMIVSYEGYDPDVYEALVLCFLQYDGKWMLNRMDYQPKMKSNY